MKEFVLTEEMREGLIKHLSGGVHSFVAPVINVLASLEEASKEEKKPKEKK